MRAIKTLDLTQPLPAIFSGHLKLGGSRPQGKTIGFTNLYMTRDGQPCIPVMGEFHFSRYPHADWEVELLKMKAGGINLAATYVFWNHIEEEVAEIKSVSAAGEQRISIKLEGSKPLA